MLTNKNHWIFQGQGVPEAEFRRFIGVLRS